MKDITGYGHLREVGAASGIYCPKCGNYLKVVMNGWFHGEVFFCPKDKKIFTIQLRGTKANPEFIKSALEDIELDEVRHKITKTNLQEMKKLIP